MQILNKPKEPVRKWVDQKHIPEFIEEEFFRRLFIVNNDELWDDPESLYLLVFPDEKEEMKAGNWRYETEEHDFGEQRFYWFFEEYSKPFSISEILNVIPDGFLQSDVKISLVPNSDSYQETAYWITAAVYKRNPHHKTESEIGKLDKKYQKEWQAALQQYHKDLAAWEIQEQKQQLQLAKDRLKKLEDQK
jgi:hypothetical protein